MDKLILINLSYQLIAFNLFLNIQMNLNVSLKILT